MVAGEVSCMAALCGRPVPTLGHGGHYLEQLAVPVTSFVLTATSCIAVAALQSMNFWLI